jgi:hypothetical protein
MDGKTIILLKTHSFPIASEVYGRLFKHGEVPVSIDKQPDGAWIVSAHTGHTRPSTAEEREPNGDSWSEGGGDYSGSGAP